MVKKNEISEKVAEFLKAGESKVSKYYHLLKTHKIPVSTENPSQWLDDNGFPLRGIISGCGSPTERISGFVDHHLQDGMKSLESYLKDTKDTMKVIEELNDKVDEGELSLEGVALVSLDIVNMYNNMSEDLGTEATKEFLESRNAQGEQGGDNFVSTKSLLDALELCLKSNTFKFNKKIYKQISGVGTGVKLAPTYACIGLGKYEQIMFNFDQTLLDKILLWKRFIDDVLMLFSGTKQDCEHLVSWLNSLMPRVVTFKFDFSYEKIEFLDLEISLKDGKLETNIFIKPTNKQLYLDFNSNHPEHCKNAIPYSQALRVVEKCSDKEKMEGELGKLKEKFKERNYPDELVDEKFEMAKKKDRRSLIFQNRKKCNSGGKKSD
jgi:hypothetical protein